MVYVIGIVAALIILFGFLCYKKAPPTEAIVVTGFGLSKPKVVCGKGTFVLPVLQRADRLNMRLLKIDVKTPETGVKTKNGLTPPTIEIVGFLGGAARFIAKPCLKQRVMRFPIIRYRRSA